MNEFRPFRPYVLGPCARTAGRSCKLRQKRRVNLMFLAAHNNTAQAYNNNDFFSLSLGSFFNYVDQILPTTY